MCPTSELQEKVDRQLDMFHNVENMFGMEMAIQMRSKKQPSITLTFIYLGFPFVLLK
mgnify:CR=1 FL=1